MSYDYRVCEIANRSQESGFGLELIVSETTENELLLTESRARFTNLKSIQKVMPVEKSIERIIGRV
jgi:hypothetical protein